VSDLLFKLLNEGGRPANGGRGLWPLPSDDKPGKWLKVDGEIVPCQNGLHLCEAKDLPTWAAPALYVVEASGKRIKDRDKIVVARARLLYRVDAWNDQTLRLFAADCAERALKREEKAGRIVDKRSWDAVRIARDFARGRATDQELASARDAARASARDAARDAETAWQTKRLQRYLKVEA
jgi:hypothetical protein